MNDEMFNDKQFKFELLRIDSKINPNFLKTSEMQFLITSEITTVRQVNDLTFQNFGKSKYFDSPK